MPLVSDRCICLRKTEYSETSQILTLLSRRLGIVRVMAKGAASQNKGGASRFDGGIDLLDVGHAVFSDDTSARAVPADRLEAGRRPSPITQQPAALYLAVYAGKSSGLFWRNTIRIPRCST